MIPKSYDHAVVTSRLSQRIVLMASNLLNFYAILIHMISSCQYSNSASKAEMFFTKKIVNHSNLFNKMNIFNFFVGTSFLIPATAQQNMLNKIS